MKTILIALLFASAFCSAQNDAKSLYQAFKQELETYRANPEVSSENSTIKPAPCGQYNLKFMVAGEGATEMVTAPPARKLCFDLNRFDKTKNPNPTSEWVYEIKPVGNLYYIIHASKRTTGAQEFYYYERKK